MHVIAYFGHLGHDLKTSTFRMSLEDEDIMKTMIIFGIPYRTVRFTLPFLLALYIYV
ncbi:unnamed protein product [Cylicostephanus goldi]|uniref:Uncharacterized protein n=1 Tax=Cylicostephanus goldi TaxID=71465 RepID=A0A3P6S5L4_CYLGO|nr:unnamed protein product [Cylicostephanus goldi]